MRREDVRRATRIAFGLVIFFGLMVSYAKSAGFFLPPGSQDEYHPLGWFSSFDHGPLPRLPGITDG